MQNTYLQALANRKGSSDLILRYCEHCQQFHWYPRAKCPLCHSLATEWRYVAPEATVYTNTVMRGRGEALYGFLCVSLDAGPRAFVWTNADTALALNIGERVTLASVENQGKGAIVLTSRIA